MAAKKAKSKKGARKSTMTNKKRKASAGNERRALIKKISLFGGGALACLWLLAWFVLADGMAAIGNWASRQTIALSADAGFIVENILVEGREYTDPDVLLAVINVGQGDPLLLLDPAEAKEQIERIGWVKTARVERRMPDTIYVHLVEREPVALWQRYGAVSLVDSEGELITNQGLEDFKDLPMVLGHNAPKKTGDLMAMLGQATVLKDMLDRAELIDNRRWDLHIGEGRVIKLPEHNTQSAIDHIRQRHQEDQILTKNAIIEIDARYDDRLIVRTRLGTVQDYKTNIHNIKTQL